MNRLSVLFDAPIDIGREQARELAQNELLDPAYARAEPPWWQRVSSWAWERFTDLLDRLGGVGGSWLWLLVLGAVIVLIAFTVVRRSGLAQRRRAVTGDMFADQVLSAADHRSRAEVAAGRGDWAAAVIEGFRAVVRQLEERGALEARAGRTADEAARDAGAVFTTLNTELGTAALAFDEVAYGGRNGTADAYATIMALDRALARSSLVGA